MPQIHLSSVQGDEPELVLMKPRTHAGVWQVEGESVTVPHPERTNRKARERVSSRPSGNEERHGAVMATCVSNRAVVIAVDATTSNKKWIHQKIKIFFFLFY